MESRPLHSWQTQQAGTAPATNTARADARPQPSFPRLSLPSFELRPRHAAPRPVARRHMPQPAPVRAVPAAAPQMFHQPRPMQVAAHAIPQPFTPAPRQYAAPRPATPSAQTFFQPAAERSWLTPMHLGMLATLVAVALVLANGPGASMRTSPVSLPVKVGPAPAGPASSTLPLKRKSQGIPSPAAAASLAVEGGGRAPRGSTSAIRLNGIPSPAAAATMGPQTLPLRRTDSMTLPRTSGERDSWAEEHHYGADVVSGGGGADSMPSAPAMTPGEAADQARLAATTQQVAANSGSAAGGIPGQANLAY